MSDVPDLDHLLSEHANVGPSKPMSYLPISTIERLLGMTIADYARLIEQRGSSCVVFAETETCIKSGAVYAYSKIDLARVLVRHSFLLAEHSWPEAPAEFVRKVAQEWLDEDNPLKRVIGAATGLAVTIGGALDEHLFEVLPGRFVRILPFACRLVGGSDVVLSHEHLGTRWLPLGELGETIAGHRLPACYLEAIRQAIDQPLSPSARVV